MRTAETDLAGLLSCQIPEVGDRYLGSVFRYYWKWTIDMDTELPNDYANLPKYWYRKLGWELSVLVFWPFLKAFLKALKAFLNAFWCFGGHSILLRPFKGLFRAFLVFFWFFSTEFTEYQNTELLNDYTNYYQNTDTESWGEKIPKYWITKNFFNTCPVRPNSRKPKLPYKRPTLNFPNTNSK